MGAAEYLQNAQYAGSEDCLYLNVQRGVSVDSHGDLRRHALPVMVWFHGGANITGSGEGYGTPAFLSATRVVLVTVNYRLGPFGFFLHPTLASRSSTPEDRSGNYGLLDQIQALRWVHDNIANFGGDPDNVTVFGVSAGAADCMGLISSPRAAGLFRRAIVMSGHVLTRSVTEAVSPIDVPTPELPDSSGELLLQLLVLDGTAHGRVEAKAWISTHTSAAIAQYLHRKSYADFDAAHAHITEHKGTVLGETLIRDGTVIPLEGIVSSYATIGHHNPVDLIIGSTRDEDKVYVLSKAPYADLVSNGGDFEYRFKDLQRCRLLSEYASKLWRINDVNEPAVALARSEPGRVFSYRLEWNEVEPWSGPDREPHGATHGMDVPLLFGFPPKRGRSIGWYVAIPSNGTAAYTAVSRAIMSYWAQFAYYGKPNRGLSNDLPQWQPWGSTSQSEHFLSFDSPKKGGIRLYSQTLTKAELMDQLASDPRLPSIAERCEFLRELRDYSTMTPRLLPDDYASFDKGVCVNGQQQLSAQHSHPRLSRNRAVNKAITVQGLTMATRSKEPTRRVRPYSQGAVCDTHARARGAQSKHEAPSNVVPPIPVDATEAQIKETAAPIRAGRALTPKVWKNGSRVAVCLSFDVDNELHTAIVNASPVALSVGEYGATTGLPRLLALLDRQRVPATFYVPAGAAVLHPEIIRDIQTSGRHEIGVHGWMHEYIPALTDGTQEKRLLTQSIDYLTRITGKRPVGYRAPSWEFGPNSIQLVHDAGFLYDSTMMAMDQPYELLSYGRDTGLIEIPVSWVLDDYAYFGLRADGSQTDPEPVFKIFRSEFDVAYEERTLFVLTMHPSVTGVRSRASQLEELVAYMKAKPGVWFATLEQVARYIKEHPPSDNSHMETGSP